MSEILRSSPIELPGQTSKIRTWNAFGVVVEFEEEGAGPHLVDLSHRPKWDLQGDRISDGKFLETAIPETPGHSRLEKGLVINRMNRVQALAWLLDGEAPQFAAEPCITELTDGLCLLALVQIQKGYGLAKLFLILNTQ